MEQSEHSGDGEVADVAAQKKRPSNRGSGSDDRAIDQLYSRGRLVHMPSMRGRNQVLRDKLLAHITATSFEHGKSYTEQEVNERLMAVYDDYTALRRYLVEDGHLMRERSGWQYWLPDQSPVRLDPEPAGPPA